MDKIEMKFKIFNSIKEITEMLLQTKNKLMNMELNGIKSNQYSILLKQYKKLLKLENDIYSKISNDYDFLSDFSNYIYQKFGIDEVDINTDFFINIDKDLVYKRINYKLNDYISRLLEKDVNIQEVEGEEIIVVNFETFKLLEEERDRFKRNSLINNYLNIDIVKLFLIGIDTYINQNRNSEFSKKLIELKYNLIFIFDDIEQECIFNDFDMKKNYLVSKMVRDLLGVSEFEYEQIKQDSVLAIIEECQNDIKIDKSNNEEYTKLLKKILISTIFSLLNEEEKKLLSTYIGFNIKNNISYKMLSLKP